MQIKIDSHPFLPLYHKWFDYGHDDIFRVNLTETPSIPPGHTKIIPAHVVMWKRPRIKIFAFFETRDNFEGNNELSAPNLFFHFTEEVISIALDNKTEHEVTIYRNTTLGFSKIVPEAVMKNNSKLLKSLPVPTKNNNNRLNN